MALIGVSGHTAAVRHRDSRAEGGPLSPLRQWMIEDMALAGLVTGPQRNYMQAMRRFTVHCRRSPTQFNAKGVRVCLPVS